MKHKSEMIWLILIFAVATLLFANALGGDFVYDDLRQFVRNPLIQDASLYGKALLSDVWAFKGDGTLTASNYWRPTFTFWSILNFQLFGLNPFGWHLLNILLHAGVCLLAFQLLRRWKLPVFPALAVTLLFTVHPLHSETVAWVSGMPDLLFSLSFLGSIWFADKWAAGEIGRTALILAIILYAAALGSKEVAMICFPVYLLIFKERGKNNETEENQTEKAGKKAKKSVKKKNPPIPALSASAIFGLLAVVFFFMRWAVLGAVNMVSVEAVGFSKAVLSVPSIFVFYLKQVLFPVALGANYPLRPVESPDPVNFVLPLAVSALALVLFYFLAKRSFIQKIGCALFFLPLLPTLNISAFDYEQIVHDRYLYLPLLGFLMMTVPYLTEILEKKFPEKAEKMLLAAAILVSLPLGVQTFFNNQVWHDEISLWKHNIEIDPTSSANLTNYGTVLTEAEQYPAALAAFNRSLDVRPTAIAYIGRGRSNISLGNYEEAIFDLQTVVEMPNEKVTTYMLYQAYEALAIAFTQKNNLPQAEKYLLEGRRRLPIYYAALTEKLAVVLYQENRKAEALRELETAQNQAKVELLPESKSVLLRLGMLYSEFNRNNEAKNVLQEYLKLTNPLQDENTLAERAQALELLKRIK